MASKQFSLEPGLSNLNETGKSSNPSVSQVLETSKKDLEDLFHNFCDEYFDSSKIMKSSTTNVETSINEEVFHEVSELFQGKSSSSSLNDGVQQSPKEVILPQTNTQSISNNMVPNVDEASTSHNVFNERLEDDYFDASTSFHDPSNVQTFYQPYPHEKKWTKDHPLHKIIGDTKSSVRTRGQLANSCLFSCLLSSIEPTNVAEALRDADWDFTVFQMDVNTAFLNGILKEEVYVGQPLVPTPMVEQAKLKLDLVGKPVDHTDYRSMIGSLIYVTSSRPDIMFATSESEYVTVSSYCAQVLWMRTQLTDYGFFYDKVPIYCDSKSAIAISCNLIQVAQKNVKIAFENADSSSRVELIPSKIKYANKVVLSFHKTILSVFVLQGKENDGLLQDQVFKNKEEVVIKAVSSGYCVFLGDNLISWLAKRQCTLFRSSVEAEYRGVANVFAKIAWLHNLLRELHTLLLFAILVYCDNVNAIYITANHVQPQRTKHIKIDIHFVHDMVTRGQVHVLHV
nr:NBS-containing resistance-like protein [Tanacetum cinerariifolium]